MHILFVDDSRATALPMIEFLRSKGYYVRYVQDGRAAVAAYQEERPDLVLMDVVMPEMDGIEATRRIKALGGQRWIPVMLMTALSNKEEIVAGLDAGADDYLIKPIAFEVLEARMRSMKRIAIMQDSLFNVLDHVFEAIITIDEVGVISSFNQAAERTFGYSAAEAIGTNVKRLMPAPYADEHDGYLARYLRDRTPHVIGIGRKVRGCRRNGEIFPMRLAVTEVRRGGTSVFIGLVSDISVEEQARERIEFLALHDPLTGLPNRAHFTDALERVLEGDGAATHAVLFIDLDGFKPINDSLGHEAGDAALKVVAGRLRHSLAAGDFVARLGGDEFVALVRDVSGPDGAVAIADRILGSLAEPMTLAGHASRIGASIGVAMIPQHGRTVTDVLTAADDAMYAAKRAGRNRSVLAPAAQV